MDGFVGFIDPVTFHFKVIDVKTKNKTSAVIMNKSIDEIVAMVNAVIASDFPFPFSKGSGQEKNGIAFLLEMLLRRDGKVTFLFPEQSYIK